MRPQQFADDKPVNWQVLKDILPYLLEHKHRIMIALAFMIAAKLASVGLPFVLKYIVDGLEDPATLAIATPLALVAVYGIGRFAIVLFNELRDTLFGRVTEHSIRRISLNTFKHLHALDINFHLNRRTGGLSRDIERGTSGINLLMRFMVFNIVPTLLEVLMIAGLLLINYGPLFSIITLVAVTAYIGYTVKTTEWRNKFIREANSADSTSNTRAVDSLLNYETVKYFTNEEFEAQRYDKELKTWQQAKRKNRLSLFALNGGQALIIAISMTVMLALAASRTASGEMTVGDFVLINAFMMQLFIPLNFLGFVYREIKGALINIEQMTGLLKKSPAIVDKPEAIALTSGKGDIEFNQVGFYYHQDRQILEDVNLNIKQGEKVAIVGDSGSGKSTLVKLLFRFYDVKHGSIKINGLDLRDISQHSLRQAIGIVPQDTVLFNDTILENIRYGRPDASDEEVLQVIELAHLKDFIAALPEGWLTKVGERGLKISGGEKQRVAIARTLLKRPDILVFDEATSALDSKSEQSIVKAMNDVGKGYTSIVIAHRLSTVTDADKIVVMQQGRIVEQGSHSDLLTQQKVYAHLWQLQQSEE